MRALSHEEMNQVSGGTFCFGLFSLFSCKTRYSSCEPKPSTSCDPKPTYNCNPKPSCDPKPVCEPKPVCNPKPVCPPVEEPL